MPRAGILLLLVVGVGALSYKRHPQKDHEVVAGPWFGKHMVLGTVQISNHKGTFALKPEGETGAEWVDKIFAINKAHVEKHGHRMVTRETAVNGLNQWQQEYCDTKPEIWHDAEKCANRWEHENNNWEKQAMMLQFLEESDVSHALIMDSDAVFTQPHTDIMKLMAERLDAEGKDMLIADEDWSEHGKGKLNGGVLFVKNTEFTRKLFSDLVQAHKEGPAYTGAGSTCKTNEQICLSAWKKTYAGFDEKLHVASGTNFNRMACAFKECGRDPAVAGLNKRTVADPELYILHFMGASKGLAKTLLGAMVEEPSSLLQVTDLTSGYHSNCNDGNKLVDCFDVHQCAKEAPKSGKYAFVVTNTLQPHHGLDMPSIESKWLEATRMKADLILVTPIPGTEYAGKELITDEQRRLLKEAGIKHVEVPWVVPPKMKFTGKKNAWCGPQDMIKLHAINMTDYDAVIFYDNDVEIQGSMMPAFRCASTGKFLSTSGPQSPLNIGFFAVKPSRELMQAVVNFAQDSDYDPETGWNGAGFAPAVGYHVAGSECGQGFMHTLMHKNTVQGWWAFINAGAKIESQQVERCVWNYQGSSGCPPTREEFNCKSIRGLHKTNPRPQDAHMECQKHNDFDLLVSARATQIPSHKRSLHKALKGSTKETYGFYMHVFGTPKAVVEQMKSLRKHFPDNPVYLSSDGGMDFSKACEKYNCKAVLHHAANDRWNPHPFFHRFTEATKWLNTRYVIYLEPDISILRSIIHEPTGDAGGLRDSYNPGLHDETKTYLEDIAHKSGHKDFKMEWGHFALGGAGYIKSEVALKAFDPTKYDWKKMHELEKHRTSSSDVAMALALGASGYQVRPWLEVMEPMKEDQPTDTAFVHHGRQEPGGKPNYHAPLEGEDKELVSDGYQKLEHVNCQGCIWEIDPDGKEPANKTPVPPSLSWR